MIATSPNAIVAGAVARLKSLGATLTSATSTLPSHVEQWAAEIGHIATELEPVIEFVTHQPPSPQVAEFAKLASEAVELGQELTQSSMSGASTAAAEPGVAPAAVGAIVGAAEPTPAPAT